MENWITILSYEYSQDAHMVKNYLESEGVAVFLKDDLTAQVAPGYNAAIGGIKLQVREKDYDIALEVLEKGGYVKDQSAFEKPEIEIVEKDSRKSKDTCPFCKSNNIEKQKNPDPILHVLNSVLGIIFPILRPPYKCNSCKRHWKYK